MTVEFVVEGELDGETPAPVVSIDPDSDDYVAPDDRGIRVVRVEGNLGLIDPDFNGLGAQGDRCVPWVYLDTGGLAGEPDSQFAVVDVQEEEGVATPIPQVPQRFLTGGMSTFFSQKPTSIPQGSSLAIYGYPAGSDKIVRVNVVAPSTALEEAKIKEACCCSNFPCITPGEPVITSVTPNSYPLDGESTATIEGEWLYTASPTGNSPDGDGNAFTLFPYDFMWVSEETGDTLPTETTGFRTSPFGGDTVIEVTFTPTPGFEAGIYRLVGFDPYDPDCNTAGQDDPVFGVFTNEPIVCPDVTAVDGATGTVGPGSGYILELSGTNLGTNDSGPLFTATLFSQFPVPSQLPITDISITVDDVGAEITYNVGFTQGSYTLTIIPLNPACPPIVFEDLIQVFPF